MCVCGKCSTYIDSLVPSMDIHILILQCRVSSVGSWVLISTCMCVLGFYQFSSCWRSCHLFCCLLWSALIILILSLCSALMWVFQYVWFDLELELCDLWWNSLLVYVNIPVGCFQSTNSGVSKLSTIWGVRPTKANKFDTIIFCINSGYSKLSKIDQNDYKSYLLWL